MYYSLQPLRADVLCMIYDLPYWCLPSRPSLSLFQRPWRRVAFYMVPTLAFSVAFNLPKFFEFVIQWAPTSRAVVVDAATNETRIENGTEMAFKGHVDRVVCFLYADKAKGLLIQPIYVRTHTPFQHEGGKLFLFN